MHVMMMNVLQNHQTVPLLVTLRRSCKQVVNVSSAGRRASLFGSNSRSRSRSRSRRHSDSSSNSSRRRAVAGDGGESSSSRDDDDEELRSSSAEGGGREREELERLVGPADDARFNGLDLANLIRNKYGRSYDVTLIKKEFMGRSLLAMNVMWKYREQRSFPLTEEEYLVRLDEVANTLKCWGAVAHVRNTLHNLKDRPRIGKAVSIFIDMDQTGARSNEWIYK